MTVLDTQMALPLAFAPRRFDTPVVPAPSNEAARAWLGRTADWPQRRLAIWGPPGCGKTSLLRDWAGRHGAALLSGPGLLARPPEPGAPMALAIDDAAAAPERVLLHLLNAAQEAGFPALLADALPPARWAVALPDLASRLRAVTAVPVGEPEDELLHGLLARLLAARQLRVPAPTLDWLVARLPRTHAAAIGAVARLDAAAQASGMAISPALARRVLPDLRGDDGFDDAAAAAFHDADAFVTEASQTPSGGLL